MPVWSAPGRVPWPWLCYRRWEDPTKSQKIEAVLHYKQPVLSLTYNRPFVVRTDTFDVGIGAVLAQTDEKGHEHPIAFVATNSN